MNPEEPLLVGLTTVIAKADVMNGNRCVYPRAVLEKALANLSEGHLFAYLVSAPESFNFYKRFEDVAGVVSNPRIDAGGHFSVDINTLPTPAGKKLMGLILNDSGSVVYRPFGTGKMGDKNQVLEYKLEGVAIVPASTAPAIEIFSDEFHSKITDETKK